MQRTEPLSSPLAMGQPIAVVRNGDIRSSRENLLVSHLSRAPDESALVCGIRRAGGSGAEFVHPFELAGSMYRIGLTTEHDRLLAADRFGDVVHRPRQVCLQPTATLHGSPAMA